MMQMIYDDVNNNSLKASLTSLKLKYSLVALVMKWINWQIEENQQKIEFSGLKIFFWFS